MTVDENKLIELERKATQMEGINAVANLMARYEYARTAADSTLIQSFFALERDDVRVEHGGIVYDGPELVRAFWEDVAANEADMRGRLYKHDLITPCIEVAEDGFTAVGVWNSIGMTTGVGDDGHYTSNWSWQSYKIDFIKIRGIWKIWHWRLYPQVQTPFTGRGWTYEPYCNFMPNVERFKGQQHFTRGSRMKASHPFSLNTVEHDMHQGYPTAPVPYKTFTPEMAELDRELVFDDPEDPGFDAGEPTDHPDKYFIGDGCVGCGICVSQCATRAIVKGLRHYSIDYNKCEACGTCVAYCPVEAIVKGAETLRPGKQLRGE